MPQPQFGMFVDGATTSEYVEFEIEPGSLTSLQQLLPLFETEQDEVGVNFIVGLRPSLLARIASEHAPKDVHDFDTDVVGSDGYTIPGTQHDLVFWLYGGARDKVFDATRHLIQVLRQAVPGVRVVDETEGWMYQTNRDLTGFIDGTENPKTIEQYAEAIIPDDEPGAGSSILLLQKWPHKQDKWEALSTEEQENVIGRTKVDSVEFDPKPERSHAERTDQDTFGNIVRRNMPYGDVGEHGTMFVGFSCEQKRLHDMLESMAGVGDYPRDDLTKYSNAETGSYYVIPPVDAFKG